MAILSGGNNFQWMKKSFILPALGSSQAVGVGLTEKAICD